MKRRTLVIAAVVIAALAGLGIWQSQRGGPSSKLTAPAACLPDPTAAINATPAGGTWNGNSQCYTVPNGVQVKASNITIAHATFDDPTNAPGPTPTGYGFHPIVDLRDDSNVSVLGVNVVGTNTTGKLDGALVGEAGFWLGNSHNVLLYADSASHTWGDCLEAWAEPPKDVTPSSQVTVSYFTGSYCGRDGLSPSDIVDSTFDHVTILKPNPNSYQISIDFESDLAGIGTGNLTFTNCSWPGGIVFGEYMSGPVTFDHGTFTNGQILLRAQQVFQYWITISNSSIGLTQKSIAGFSLSMVNLALVNDVVTRPTVLPRGYVYTAYNHSTLSIVGTPLPPPPGTVDATSTVTVTP